MINIDGTAYCMPKDAEVAVRRVLCRLDTTRTQLTTAKEENKRLRVALGQIQAEARSNVKCRPIVHDIAQQVLKGE